MELSSRPLVAVVLVMSAFSLSSASAAAPTAADEKETVKVESEIQAFAAASDLAQEIARQVRPVIQRGTCVKGSLTIVTEREPQALRGLYYSLLQGLQDADEDVLKALGGCKKTAATGTPKSMGTPSGFSATTGDAAAGLGLLTTLLGIAEDSITLSGEHFDLDGQALASLVAADLASSRLEIYLPEVAPGTGRSPLLDRLTKLQRDAGELKACAAADTTHQEASERLSSAATALTTMLSAPEIKDARPNIAAQLLIAEGTLLHVNDRECGKLLVLRAPAAGGTNMTRSSFLLGARAFHSGGAILTYGLFDPGGRVLATDTLADYEGYVKATVASTGIQDAAKRVGARRERERPCDAFRCWNGAPH